MQCLWHQPFVCKCELVIAFDSHLVQCLPPVAWAEVVHEDKAPAARYIGDFFPIRRRPELWQEPPHSPAVVHFAGLRVPCKLGHTLLAIQSDAVNLVVALQALGTVQHQQRLWDGLALQAGSS